MDMPDLSLSDEDPTAVPTQAPEPTEDSHIPSEDEAPRRNPSRKKKRTRRLHASPEDNDDMPATVGPKRLVKGYQIERHFLIGSESYKLPEDPAKRRPGIPPEHTKGWKVYVRQMEGQPDINAWLKKVQFKLWHTYNPANRTVEGPVEGPLREFAVEETGWGGFNVEIKLFFQTYVAEKAQHQPWLYKWRNHFLQLEPYGSPEEIKLQNARNLVKSEIMETIIFTDPPEPLWNALTDESQFDYMKQPVRGKGKGKGKASVPRRTDIEPTAELPEKGTEELPYSKEMERAEVAKLQKMQAEAEAELQREHARMEELQKRLSEMGYGPLP